MYYIPGTLNNHFLVLVSVGWFQIVYSKNGCFTKHPLKNCCLEFHGLNEWYDIIKCCGPSDMTILMYDLINNLSYIMIRSRTLHHRVFQWWRWNVLRQNTCNIVQNLLQVLFQTRMITSPREKNKSKQKQFPNLRSYVTDSHQDSSGSSNFQLLNNPKKVCWSFLKSPWKLVKNHIPFGKYSNIQHPTVPSSSNISAALSLSILSDWPTCRRVCLQVIRWWFLVAGGRL